MIMLLAALVATASVSSTSVPSFKPSKAPSKKPSKSPSKAPTSVLAPKPLTPYSEPVVLKSQNKVLEVILYVRQGTATFNTVDGTVDKLLVFDWDLVKGTSSDSTTSGRNQFLAPTLNVYPDEILTIYVVNQMQNLTMKDFFSQQFRTGNEPIPLFPAALTASPFNLHFHGAHVSPVGNEDNIIIEIPAGKFNKYSYAIPKTMPYGLFWYHSHRHQYTEIHTSRGLVGMIVVGTVDGGLPVVTQNQLKTRTMSLQVTNVFGRAQGLKQYTNHFITSFANTLITPTAQQLMTGTYKPVLAPFNFLDSPSGTTFVTEWFTGPNASSNPNNGRGFMQYIPTNLKSFTSKY